MFLTISTEVYVFYIKTNEYAGLIRSVMSLFFCLSVGVIKKITVWNKKKERKNIIKYFTCINKLDCIEMLISQSIMDLNISHEELKMIMGEKYNR